MVFVTVKHDDDAAGADVAPDVGVSPLLVVQHCYW